MSKAGPGQTLQATALVHEAWIKLSGDEERSWSDRSHFFRAAAQAMRHILVDRARAKASLKRGGIRICSTSRFTVWTWRTPRSTNGCCWSMKC